MRRDEKPSSWYTGKLRASLARMGVDIQKANELVTMAKTRGQIATDIIDYIRQERRNSRMSR